MPVHILPPLTVGGNTLAIPRASATQSGYLSKEDFILFSPEGFVAVTSFNTRTGEIILLEDDVLAALGYSPIGSSPRPFILNAGDTMAGPLLLPSGDPPSAFAAAHRAFVETSVATAGGFAPAKYFPRTWWLSDFNFSGSSQQFTGAISNASSTLTLSSGTHDFVVGQGICIVGAGTLASIDPGSNLLVTTITAISGATITLADPATHTVSSSAVVRHDDTVALQTAINTVFAAGGGTIICDAVECWLNGPLTDINSIIKIPYNIMAIPPGITSGGNPTVPIAIVGPPQSFPGWATPPSTKAQGQAVFRTNRIGANADSSMIAGALFSRTDFYAYSNTTLYLTNLTWRTYPNPQISGVDTGMINAIVNNVTVDSGPPLNTTVVEPTHGTFGLRATGGLGGTTFSDYNQIYVHNYDTGIVVSEMFRCNYFFTMCCNVGIQCDFGWGPAWGRGLIWHCKQWIKWTDTLPVDFTINVEVGDAGVPVGGAWNQYQPGNDLYDPKNVACGVVRYMKSQGFLNTKFLASNTGCQNLTLINLHGLGNKLAGPITGELVVENLRVEGTLRLQDEPLTFGANDGGGAGLRNVVVGNPNIGTSELTKDLISYWTMDETTGIRADKTGNNPLTGGSPVAGKLGNAATGSLVSVYMPDATGQSFGVTNISQVLMGSFSISGWMNINTLPGPTGFHALLSKWSVNQYEFLLLYEHSSSSWKFVLSKDGSAAAPSLGTAAVNVAATTGTWYHIAAVYDYAAGQVRLRINDGAVGANTGVFTGRVFNGGASLYVMNAGILNLSAGLISDCAVDELGWWNRALSASEITALYGGGTPPAYSTWG